MRAALTATAAFVLALAASAFAAGVFGGSGAPSAVDGSGNVTAGACITWVQSGGGNSGQICPVTGGGLSVKNSTPTQKWLFDQAGNATFSGLLKPAFDAAQDIGSTSLRWANFYLSSTISDGTNYRLDDSSTTTLAFNGALGPTYDFRSGGVSVFSIAANNPTTTVTLSATTAGSALVHKANLVAGSTATDHIFDTAVNRTAGSLMEVKNNGVSKLSVTTSGGAAFGSNVSVPTGASFDLSGGGGQNLVYNGTSVVFGGGVTLHTSSGKLQATGHWTAEAVGVSANGATLTGYVKPVTAEAFRTISCDWTAAGTGAGTLVMRVRNVTDASDLCTCTISGTCATAAGTGGDCDCNTLTAAAKKYQLIIDATSSCATYPTNVICNIEEAQ